MTLFAMTKSIGVGVVSYKLDTRYKYVRV